MVKITIDFDPNLQQAIEDFKRDVLSSSLIINLNESFNANIDESKVNVIDHEE